MIDIESLVDQKLPKQGLRRRLLARPLITTLRSLFREREFKQFAARYPHACGFDFVEKVLDYFDFTYSIRNNEIERVPSTGRVVIIANHPIGSLDGLALLKLVRSIRPDVKIVANELLMEIKPMHPVLLPVDNMGGNTAKENIQAIRDYLNKDAAVIIFPSGVVSRFGWRGIRDSTWRSGFLRFAEATESPILPIYLKGRNSTFFYGLSLVAKVSRPCG